MTLPPSDEVVAESIKIATMAAEQVRRDGDLHYVEIGMLTADLSVLSIRASTTGTTVKLDDEVLL